MVLPDMKIMFPNSTMISVANSTSVQHMFSPLKIYDGGQYTCTATINIPQAGIRDLQSSVVETFRVVGKMYKYRLYSESMKYYVESRGPRAVL